MNALFEYSDRLNVPYECFVFEANGENFPIQSHWHYFMEIIYMIEGTAMMNCDDQSYVLNQGDLIIFLPHQIHSIYSVANITLKYYVLKFDISQLAFGGVSGHLVGGIHLNALFRIAKNNAAAKICFRGDELKDIPLNSIFYNACHEIEKKDYGYGIMLQADISMLLTHVLRKWREGGFDTDKAFSLITDEQNIDTIAEYIDSHIQEPLKVEELAKLCHMSYSHFAKTFREAYGQSCKKYIEFVRLFRAEDLLLFTNQDMSYISQETGFSDCSHFIKAFKEKYGMTPKQYRTKHENVRKTM